jgi:formate dehydrogenase
MAKVICVLCDDPIGGYPKPYARDDIPRLAHYPGGQTLPSPKRIDFKPGSYWAVFPVSSGCVSFSKNRATR